MREYTNQDTRDAFIPRVITERRAYFDVMGERPTFVKFAEPYYDENGIEVKAKILPVEELQAHLQEDAAMTSRLLGD